MYLLPVFPEKVRKSHQPECVPGIFKVRPDTSDTAETALLPELVTDSFYHWFLPVTRSFFFLFREKIRCCKTPSLPCRILQNLHHHDRVLHHFPAGTPVLSVKLT